MTKLKVIMFCAVIVLIVGGLWLRGQERGPKSPSGVQTRQLMAQSQAGPSAARPTAATPTIGTPSATPSVISVNTSTTVTITARIADPTLIQTSVNLLRLGATGTQPTILGVMHDDGLNGDAVAGDKIYTVQISFNEPAARDIGLEVSAAFRGFLQRSLSPVFTLHAWPSVATLQVTLNYPPSALIVNNDASSTSIQTSAEYDPTGASAEDIAPITQEGFEFSIEQRPPVVGSFDVNAWLGTNFPLWQPTAIQMTSIGGKSGYYIPAVDPSDYSTIIVPTAAFVYVISYNTSYFSSQSAEAGQAQIQTMLSTVVFH